MEELYANTAVVECLKGVLKTLLDNHLLRRDAALEVFNTALKVCSSELRRTNSTGSYNLGGELLCYRFYMNHWIFWIKQVHLNPSLPGGLKVSTVKLVVAPREMFAD